MSNGSGLTGALLDKPVGRERLCGKRLYARIMPGSDLALHLDYSSDSQIHEVDLVLITAPSARWEGSILSQLNQFEAINSGITPQTSITHPEFQQPSDLWSDNRVPRGKVVRQSLPSSSPMPRSRGIHPSSLVPGTLLLSGFEYCALSIRSGYILPIKTTPVVSSSSSRV